MTTSVTSSLAFTAGYCLLMPVSARRGGGLEVKVASPMRSESPRCRGSESRFARATKRRANRAAGRRYPIRRHPSITQKSRGHPVKPVFAGKPTLTQSLCHIKNDMVHTVVDQLEHIPE